MTNCKNCGAVLSGDKCEYCGTDYSLKINLDEGLATFAGETFGVYRAEINYVYPGVEAGRDENGNLVRPHLKPKRTITVTEF